jgi:hypothetical protein
MYWINCKTYDKHNDTPINEVVVANFDKRDDCEIKLEEIVEAAVKTKRVLKYKDGSVRIEFLNGRATEYIIGTDESAATVLNANEIKAQLDRIEKLLSQGGVTKETKKAVDEIKEKVVKEAKTEIETKPENVEIEQTIDTQTNKETTEVEDKKNKTKKKN